MTSYIDIGTLDLTCPKKFPPDLIRKILTTRFVPHKNWKPPRRQLGKYRRRVPEKLFNSRDYPTLSYSVVQDGLYCAPCVVFHHSESILIGKPLQDWSNAIRHTMYHLHSKKHHDALEMSARFLERFGEEGISVDNVGLQPLPMPGWQLSNTTIC